MDKFMPIQRACVIMMVLFGLLAVVQVLVLVGVVPMSIVWGGQLDNSDDAPMFFIAPLFVGLALLALVAFALLVALRAGWLGRTNKLYRYSHYFMWLQVFYFALNTVGNLAAQSGTETLLFTPVSVALCLLALRLALRKPSL